MSSDDFKGRVEEDDGALLKVSDRAQDEAEWSFDGAPGIERFCDLIDERLARIGFWLLEAKTSAEGISDVNVPSDLDRMTEGVRSLSLLSEDLRELSQGDSVPRARMQKLEREMQSWVSLILGYAEMVVLSATSSDIRDLVVPVRTICAEGRVVTRLIKQLTSSRTGSAALVKDEKAPFFVRVDQERRGDEMGAGANLAGNILVVDADRTSRSYLTQWLSLEDFAVTSVSTPDEGARLMGLGNFDLCLIDLAVMGSGGLELLRRIKGDHRTENTQVVIVFEHQPREILARCLELGADDFLFKPIHPGVLQLRVQACLERKRNRERLEELSLELAQTDRTRMNVLQVVLTDDILGQVKDGAEVQPRASSNCAVLFCRVVSDPKSDIPSAPLHKLTMHRQVTLFFYDIMERYGMNRLRTVGDTFLAVAGLGRVSDNPVHTALRCVLEMQRSLEHYVPGWRIEAGIHMGPLVVGFLGEQPILYSMAADTVNKAARIAAVCGTDTIALSRFASTQVQDSCILKPLSTPTTDAVDALEIYQMVRFKTEEDLREELPIPLDVETDSKVG